MLTHCSLSSEKAFLSVSPQAESSVLGMGSLPHGLERMEPTQGRGLSRWESPWTQNITSSGDTDSASGKVTAADVFKNSLHIKKVFQVLHIMCIISNLKKSLQQKFT